MRLAVAGCVFAAVLVLSTTNARAAVAADERMPPSYSPPVPGAIVDDFRPPQQKWGAGNRGVDFDAPPGEPVVAAADGEVVFAGSVAGAKHVVVLHADGLRTSYSFLADVDVHRGERVVAGQQVGVAGGPVHFGVRAGDEYLDPLTVLAGGPPQVHLVDDRVGRPGTVAEERNGLTRFLRGASRTVATAGDWVRDRAVDEMRARLDAARYLGEHAPPVVFARIGAAVVASQTRVCTPAGALAPPHPPGERLLVRVAGLGSYTGTGTKATDAGAIADVDAAALGYDDAHDVQFSYAGGSTDERGYAAADTLASLRESGARLAAFLDRLAAEHPGVPIDVVAHSQGGLVARVALTATRAPVANVVTYGTPHHGADLATALARVRTTQGGAVAAAAIGTVDPLGIDPDAPAVADLAEGSDFIRWLDDQPLPEGAALTSIAGRHDWAVPVPRAHLDGATNVVVDPTSRAKEHDALPGSPEAALATALALAGAPPPCESLRDVLADQLVGEGISFGEDALGAGVRSALG
jgi:pimeloyl-ACP methyl ester carboxylesterase